MTNHGGFSWNRLLGITAAKRKASRATGIPWTKSGRQRKIADFYDQEVEATVEALTSLIEPLLIVVMGAAIGGMVISLYLPMFNIIKLIK